MKLRCLLVDDEPPALKILESYIASMDNMEMAGKCFNAFDAIKVLQQKPIDLIFLDIKLPSLLGTEFLRTLRNPPKVIFTSAYKEYAVEGFELDAVDYLLKPFSLERFIRAVNKVTSNNNELLAPVQENAVINQDTFLYFRVDRKMVKVMLDEVVYIESLKDYVKIVRVQQKPLIVKKSISSVEEMLPSNLFVRIHRSFIIALKKVTAFTQSDVEINGIEIPIGKLYSHHVTKLNNQ
jgi:DNA-binding LytR/AlgR family response regulator